MTTYNSTCPDCKGSGQYIGLNIVECCSYCHGTGRRPLGELFDWLIAHTDKAKWDCVSRALNILNTPETVRKNIHKNQKFLELMRKLCHEPELS